MFICFPSATKTLPFLFVDSCVKKSLLFVMWTEAPESIHRVVVESVSITLKVLYLILEASESFLVSSLLNCLVQIPCWLMDKVSSLAPSQCKHTTDMGADLHVGFVVLTTDLQLFLVLWLLDTVQLDPSCKFSKFSTCSLLSASSLRAAMACLKCGFCFASIPFINDPTEFGRLPNCSVIWASSGIAFPQVLTCNE